MLKKGSNTEGRTLGITSFSITNFGVKAKQQKQMYNGFNC